MLRRMVTFAAVAAVLFALARPAAANFATGFESPMYSTASELVPQDGWATQFGGPWHVEDYATSQIPWVPQSTGVLTYYTAPVNPNGGNQFVGKGTDDQGGSGGGRAWHAATQSGLVEVSVDFCNGPEHDFPNYQGSIVSRGNWSGSGPGNMVGIYTTSASSFVEPEQPNPNPPPPRNPRAGNWAFNVMAFDAAGNQLNITNTPYHPFYRFSGVPGFDELPRETWWRMGYVIDTNSRRLVQLKSQNLMTGEMWIMDNPQADVGAGPVDMYILGGAAGTDPLDAVGIYNVGNGQLSMFDNVYVGDPYDWPTPGAPEVEIPEPLTLGALGLAFAGLGGYARRRKRL